MTLPVNIPKIAACLLFIFLITGAYHPHHSSTTHIILFCYAFSPAVTIHIKSTSQTNHILWQTKQDPSKHFDQSESDEVRNQILTLSLESDDEHRRMKLKSLLEDKLTQDDVSDAAKFAHLWDINIIQIGSEIQNDARLEAEHRSASSTNEENNVAYGNENDKSVKETQLWAMVDMMVQSKSIIKKMMKEI